MSSAKRNHNKGFRSAFGNAFAGFRAALQTERNLRLHLLIGLIVILCSFILQINLIELGILLLIITIVVVSELFNTAMESVVDLASPEKHDLAKRAKDISAAAVLASASCSVVIGLIIFGPKLWRILGF